MGAYLSTLRAPNPPFIAIPVFVSRAFRHASVYLNADAGITRVADLGNRTIGTPEWSMTASLWMRGILAEHYGVDLTSIHWRTGGLEQPGRREKSPVTPPAGFRVTRIGDTETLTDKLLRGDIDALITARTPSAFLRCDPRIIRLWTDFRGAERAYFEATAVIPIMHVVVLKRELVAAHPWLANNLVEAFDAARRPVQRELLDTAVSTSSLIWESAYAQDEAAIFGDPFRNGVAENKASLDALLAYAHHQGFTDRVLSYDEVFVPSTVSSARV